MEILRSTWLFIQDQVLGMKWLNTVIGNGLSALGLDTTSRLGGSIQFFLYDVVKITVLLCVLIFVISYIQSYFPPERSKRIPSPVRHTTKPLLPLSAAALSRAARSPL